MKLEDQKDIMKSKLVDVAEGRNQTSFIFRRKDGSLHGFRVKNEEIELCDFKELKK